MIRGDLLLAYTATNFVAAIMPGPAVLSVASIGLTGALRGMAGTIAGINSANLLWYAMVGAGLIALAHTFPHLFDILGWIGIGYLAWLGIQTWQHPAHISLSAKGKSLLSFPRGMASGIALQLSNPKALVFFTVFLPPFIDTSHAVPPQLVILAMAGIALETAVLTSYGLLAWRIGRITMSTQAETTFARISGSILIAIATAMAISRLT